MSSARRPAILAQAVLRRRMEVADIHAVTVIPEHELAHAPTSSSAAQTRGVRTRKWKTPPSDAQSTIRHEYLTKVRAGDCDGLLLSACRTGPSRGHPADGAWSVQDSDQKYRCRRARCYCDARRERYAGRGESILHAIVLKTTLLALIVCRVTPARQLPLPLRATIFDLSIRAHRHHDLISSTPRVQRLRRHGQPRLRTVTIISFAQRHEGARHDLRRPSPAQSSPAGIADLLLEWRRAKCRPCGRTAFTCLSILKRHLLTRLYCYHACVLAIKGRTSSGRLLRVRSTRTDIPNEAMFC